MPTIKNRRATDAQWAAENPILASGEVGYEINTNKHKIGNGFSTWSELRYFIDEAAVAALIAAAGGGGGDGAPIDDSVVALDKLWSSKKTSDELVEKANDLFVVMSEPGVFINVVTGEIVDIDTTNPTKYGLQMGLASVYQMAATAQPKYVETATLITGAISVGVSSRLNGFQSNPLDVELNNVAFLSVFLTTPSTSGPVKFNLRTTSLGGGSSESSAIFTIPQGETEVFFTEPGWETRPEHSVYQDGDVLGVRITEAGTGATGFKVRALRKN